MEIRANDPVEASKFFQQKLTFTVGPIEVEKLMDKGQRLSLLDVRKKEDYEKGHLPGAISVPEEDWESLKGLKRDEPNIVYCYSMVCDLAARAAFYFATRGFSVVELEGGMKEWKAHNLPVDQESP